MIITDKFTIKSNKKGEIIKTSRKMKQQKIGEHKVQVAALKLVIINLSQKINMRQDKYLLKNLRKKKNHNNNNKIKHKHPLNYQ